MEDQGEPIVEKRDHGCGWSSRMKPWRGPAKKYERDIPPPQWTLEGLTSDLMRKAIFHQTSASVGFFVNT